MEWRISVELPWGRVNEHLVKHSCLMVREGEHRWYRERGIVKCRMSMEHLLRYWVPKLDFNGKTSWGPETKCILSTGHLPELDRTQGLSPPECQQDNYADSLLGFQCQSYINGTFKRSFVSSCSVFESVKLWSRSKSQENWRVEFAESSLPSSGLWPLSSTFRSLPMLSQPLSWFYSFYSLYIFLKVRI